MNAAPRHLTLHEYQTSAEIPLTLAECVALRSQVPSIDISPSPVDKHFDLRPGSEIGAVAIGDLQIDIRAKIPIPSVLFLIAYSLDPQRWQDIGFDFEEHESLTAAMIPGFIHQVRRALARGLLHGYRTEDDSLTTIRGRLRFDDQVRARLGRFPPAEVRYDDFTPDIEENRLLAAAILQVLRMEIRSALARRLLQALRLPFAVVSSVDYDPRQIPEMSYTRLNEHYRPAVELARLILRATSFDLAGGRVRSSTFLVDMNRVFEDFVIAALHDALDVSPLAFPQGARGRYLWLDEAKLIALKPDLSWWDGSRCTFVGDAKYKKLTTADYRNADIYQALAYAVAADLPGALLIYAAGEDVPRVHRVSQLGKEIVVRTLTLGSTPTEVLNQVARLAQMIRAMKYTNVTSMASDPTRDSASDFVPSMFSMSAV